MRDDDTNPITEEARYVDTIQEDVRWLGWGWDEHLYYASDYFEQMYDYAVQLIKKGLAYVCDLNANQISEYRIIYEAYHTQKVIQIIRVGHRKDIYR
ncbi:MAG: glutaminyl-tRNA synthetase [Candidatus Scalindua rubra]|uniref:Glutaminyl-tRNA synthetase n=1 Tax=Candidatus Scalindua rubra TaxID=1872076 RepID=A0A1E3XG65_9BACT|nr:MAG: glutaminyl-tRNA synthetase [Candidatus Scalindua rubra]